MKTLATTLLTIGAAAVISACDRSPPDPTTGMPADRPATATQPAPTGGAPASAPATAGRADPSLPPADSAVAVPPPPPPQAGTDTRANPPLGEMDRQKEGEQMPRALDGNNHSSPNTGSAPAR